ncbi:MAG: glycosyltransferase family 2 protein [Anaerolineae bacterium]|nr:glycosyltransferase family 2 protein [Anaerolineae bacterium]
MSEPLVAVVIPTVRGRSWLPACIAALRQQTFRDFEIIVVDNGSSDGSAAWLEAQSDVRVIRNERNLGFAAACNQGIRAGRAPFVALLNDDTQPEPQWLEALMRAIRDPTSLVPSLRSARVGTCASLMLFADRPTVVQSAGIAVDRAAIAWDRLRGCPADCVEAQTPSEVFGASGGACLYSRAMLDEIGLLDERFFAYLEDVDLAWRAQRAGWRCLYVPQARVLHRASATSGEGSAFKHRLLGRNKVWLVAKNARLRDAPIIAFYDLAAVMYAGIVRGEWSHLAGRVEGLNGIRQYLPRARHRRDAHPPPFDPLVAPWRVPRRIG